MTISLKAKLIGECHKAFFYAHEKGGGYSFRFYHSLRVMKYCEKFLQMDFFKKRVIDKDVLLTAALFHDIGKVKAVSKTGELLYGSQANKQHDIVGAQIVSEYVDKYFKNKRVVKKKKKIIREQHSSEQSSLESKMVKDADRFDNYGYLQIWRHITYAHQNRRNIDQVFEYWFIENARESAEAALKKFHYSIIRKVARDRFKKLDFLIKEIKKESEGLDIAK